MKLSSLLLLVLPAASCKQENAGHSATQASEAAQWDCTLPVGISKTISPEDNASRSGNHLLVTVPERAVTFRSGW
ncbi:hypothetical protein [Chitinophaga varians]|uniref:hypothetical protein n=1 Tax=Chitinophaga varians TaxID=2202339 RepID=UPI00165F3D3B|nr:hypothetical protein [Chitinophaga varians]MBC9912746.1 hypothetical protein [Chitinophaga varians]